jgi:Fe-S-cluster-containing dehydrogenase component
MTVMAILQDVDKCMRCNGCVVACKREWNLRAETIGVHNVAYDQRVAIKSQKRVDMGPFVRFSCWHCTDAPCARACPVKNAAGKFALTWNASTGAVAVDPAICDPTKCVDRFGQYPCQVNCQRGGYPKLGKAYVGNETVLMNKCILCAGRAGATADLDPTAGAPLQTRATTAEIAASPGRAHEPACVSTCPAKAMKWDSKVNIVAYLQDPANGYTFADGTVNVIGGDSMFWASAKTLLAPPKADPFIEDHVAPMVSGMLTGAVAKAVVLPTLVVGGLLAISSRRAKNEVEAVTGGEV